MTPKVGPLPLGVRVGVDPEPRFGARRGTRRDADDREDGPPADEAPAAGPLAPTEAGAGLPPDMLLEARLIASRLPGLGAGARPGAAPSDHDWRPPSSDLHLRDKTI